MEFPKQVSVYTAVFQDVGLPTEILKVNYNYPTGNPGFAAFSVGADCFLENPSLTSSIPDDQLISSLSMAAILAGNILPGTQEYIDAVTGQSTKYFQTIIGSVTLKSVVPVDDLTVGPAGTVYDVTFNKQGAVNNTKTVRIDAWSISQYDNRVDSPAHAIGSVPGAVQKQFSFKKSDLGVADSANRLAVINYIQTTKFWI